MSQAQPSQEKMRREGTGHELLVRMENKEINKEKFARNLQAGEITMKTQKLCWTIGSGLCGKSAGNAVPVPTLHPSNKMMRTKSLQSVTSSSKLDSGRMKSESHWSSPWRHRKEPRFSPVDRVVP